MSGGLRDLASWALRGGAGAADDGDNETNAAAGQTLSSAPQQPPDGGAPRTAAELRAQRLQRMEELQRQQQQQQQEAGMRAGAESTKAEPMDIDDDDGDGPHPAAAPKKKESSSGKSAKASKIDSSSMQIDEPDTTNSKQHQQQSSKRSRLKLLGTNKTSDSSPADPAKKLQRKKELLLKKVLGIVLVADNNNSNNNSSKSDASVTAVDTGSSEISPGTIAEILAARLSLEPSSSQPGAPRVVQYAGSCHRRAGEELKTLQSSSRTAASSTTATNAATSSEALAAILREIQTQLVSYTATCLQEPDLFPAMARDGAAQLAHCLLHPTETVNLTLGGGGRDGSFYHNLVAELHAQSPDGALPATVAAAVDHYLRLLQKCESVTEPAGDASAAAIVSALAGLCAPRAAAAAVAALPNFLLPPPGTPEARETIRPALPTGANALQRLLASSNGGDQYRPYQRRSGPGLEKHTVLGQCLRLGAPVGGNPAFGADTVLRQSLASVDAATRAQRQQLQHYQAACHQLCRNLLTCGGGRDRVLRWFADALQVNEGAAALRPDPSRVSGRNLRLNCTVLLLKLCEPVALQPSSSAGGGEAAQQQQFAKQHLVDAGFVAAEAGCGGLFPRTGDAAVARLGGGADGGADGGDDGDGDGDGDNTSSSSSSNNAPPYNPKNSFIPHIFFCCARSLHYGLVPLLDQHENLLRNISHFHYQITARGSDPRLEPRFAALIARQRTDEVALLEEHMVERALRFGNFLAKVLLDMDDATLRTMPEDFVSDTCSILLGCAVQCPKQLGGIEFRYVFQLVVKLLSPQYASMVKNYNLRAQLGDVLYEIFLPRTTSSRRDDVPASVACDPLAGGQTYLLSDKSAQETLAPSLLLLYGEVEHTGYYDKMSHRAKIASLIKYLWESKEHRPAFRAITKNTVSFIKFANGIMNETNTLIATVMQKLPEIREAQEKMKNTEEWGRLSEEEQEQISSRLEDNERDVKSSLPLCNKTLQMFGYLNTDKDIRNLFLLEELCSRLVTMLLHVLTKLVGSKGLDLKVDNPEQYDFRPKEMLRDLCAIFALFASSQVFQTECANASCNTNMLRKAVQTCQRHNLLTGESMEAFQALPDAVELAAKRVAIEEELLEGAPDEFMDALLSTFMKDPVKLPSSHIVDRSTITQHLLNDPTDPFSRAPLKIEDVEPAKELKEKMNHWLAEKRAARDGK